MTSSACSQNFGILCIELNSKASPLLWYRHACLALCSIYLFLQELLTQIVQWLCDFAIFHETLQLNT